MVKKSLKDCFTRNESNKDKDLQFGRNFFRRKAASLSEAQKEELAKWEAEICGDGVALRPAVDTDFSRLLELLEKRKTELQELGKTCLKDCFTTNERNKDKDFKFGKKFFSRKAASLTRRRNLQGGKQRSVGIVWRCGPLSTQILVACLKY